MLARQPRKRELHGEPQVSQPPQKKGRNVERRFKKRRLQEVLEELCVRVESNDRQLTNNLIRELDTEHVRVIGDEEFTANCTQILKACLTAKIETVSNKLFACLLAMFARGSQENRQEFVISLENVCEGLAKAAREAAKVAAAESTNSDTTSPASSSPDKDSKAKTSASSGTDAGDDSSDIELGYDPVKRKKMQKRKKIVPLKPEDPNDENPLEEDEEITMVDAFFLKPNLDCGVLSIYTQALREGLVVADLVPEKIRLCARRSLAQASLSTTANRIAALEFYVAMEVSRFLNMKPQEPEKPREPVIEYNDIGEEIRRDDPEMDRFSPDYPPPTPRFQITEGEAMLLNLAVDRDFRVRKSVVEGLLQITKVVKITKGTYFTAKMFLTDADPDIRIAAIRLLMYYATTVGDEFIDEFYEDRPPKTISDDAFVIICDAINDIDIAVRVEAAKQLGEFNTVSEALIYQTLDKKMMRSDKNKQVVKVEQSLFALSKKASAKGQNSRWKFAKKAPKVAETRGGWSRGKELNAICPQEDEKKDEEEEGESIIPHGACGVFVTALEDEFMDVRKAAVYSLGRLACTRPAFAVSALEYLADMFNDEIADVRLDAINALTPLISHGQMNSEQLNVISKCLDDAMPESRQAMRELLKRAQFADVGCVEMCVKALLACLRRFPRDKEQVYSCMAVIGRNHAVQVQAIMRSLLGIHLIFHTRETSIEDQEYVGKLIMVLNAAASQPSLVYFMPEFVHRHYRLLRNSYPGIVKSIRVLDEEKLIGGKAAKNGEDLTNEKAEDVVLNTYKRLCSVSSTPLHNDRNTKRDDIFRDTSAISLYNSSVSGAARLIFCLGEVSSTVDSMSNTVLQGGELTNVKQLITQSIEDMKSVEHQFSGISVHIHAYLIHCRFFLGFLDLLVWMMQVMAPQQEVLSFGQSIIQEARGALEACKEVPEPLLEFLSSCESIFFPPALIPVTANSTEEKRKIITPNTLIELLLRSTPALPTKFPPVSTIHLKYARITSPNKDTAVEECLKFFAHLPHGMPLEFDLFNMKTEELDLVRIKTIHPDSRFDVMKPRREEFRREKGHVSVSTQVKITSSSPWAEPAEIDVVIGILSDNKFVPLFASPSCFSPAHIRVRIHPHSR